MYDCRVGYIGDAIWRLFCLKSIELGQEIKNNVSKYKCICFKEC